MKKNFKVDLESLNNLIARTWQIIQDDPLVASSREIDNINKDFEEIYNNISKDGKEKKEGFISGLFWKWIDRDPDFGFKNFEWKIESIFSQFDCTKESIDGSINLFSDYKKDLEKEVNKLAKSLESTNIEELNDDNLSEYKALTTLLETLEWNLLRIETRLDSSRKISKSMEINRPMFQTLLSSVLVEVAWQRATESAIKVIGTMSGTIERLSTKLTDDTEKTARFALKAEMQPLLCAPTLKENALRLNTALEEIKKEKDRLLLQAG